MCGWGAKSCTFSHIWPISSCQPQSRNKLVRARRKRFWTLESSALFCLSADTSIYFNNCSGWVRWLSQTFEQLEGYVSPHQTLWNLNRLLQSHDLEGLCFVALLGENVSCGRNVQPEHFPCAWWGSTGTPAGETGTNSSHDIVKTCNFWLLNHKNQPKNPRF